MHLVFDGPPCAPRHLEFDSGLIDNGRVSKKDVGGLIKRMLYKCPSEGKGEVFPGCFIEKKSFSGLLQEFERGRKKIYV